MAGWHAANEGVRRAQNAGSCCAARSVSRSRCSTAPGACLLNASRRTAMQRLRFDYPGSGRLIRARQRPRCARRLVAQHRSGVGVADSQYRRVPRHPVRHPSRRPACRGRRVTDRRHRSRRVAGAGIVRSKLRAHARDVGQACWHRGRSRPCRGLWAKAARDNAARTAQARSCRPAGLPGATDPHAQPRLVPRPPNRWWPHSRRPVLR